MAELRWVLLALGVLLVVGVYLWGRGTFRRNGVSGVAPRHRAEPHISTDPALSSDDVLFAPPGEQPRPWREPRPGGSSEEAAPSSAAEEPRTPEPRQKPPPAPEKVVAIRFVPKDGELDGEKAVLSLREAGLRHGRYGIFHYHDESHPDEPQFSVASLTEPGSFDLEHLAEKPLAGMSFFMVLPGGGDPVDRFDRMVETARSLAHELNAELFDDGGSSWSIQRERYVREELIRYRLQRASY